jgi:hypothetical protein
MGVRELLVEQKHAKEAVELCKEIKEDMLLYMTEDATHKISDDVLSVKKKAKDHSPWEPFTFANAYNGQYSEDNDKVDSVQNKRSKNTYEKGDTKSQRASYKDMVEKNSKIERPNSTEKLDMKDDESVTIRKDLKQTKEEVESLKTIIHDIQRKQDEQDQKHEASTKKMINEIQKNTEQTKLFTIELQSTKKEVREAKINMVSQAW